jgi:hypothetical protein
MPFFSRSQTEKETKMDNRQLQIILAFSFGVVFVTVLLVLSVAIQNPTATTFFIFRTVLALAAAGVGAVIPGLLVVNVSKLVRAGGALALFVLVFLVNPPALVVTADSELVERGEIALSGDDTTTAISLFQEALKYNTVNWRAYSGLARSFYKRGDYKSASSFFIKAIEVSNGLQWSPIFGLSMAQEGQGDIKGAIESLILARSIIIKSTPSSPSSIEILFDQGRLNLMYWLAFDAPKHTPNFDEGISAFTEFVERGGYPKHWALYHLACFKAVASQQTGLPEYEVSLLNKQAGDLLLQSAQLLANYESPKAASQRVLFRHLLLNTEHQPTKPGDPIPCPVLSTILKALHNRHVVVPGFIEEKSF